MVRKRKVVRSDGMVFESSHEAGLFHGSKNGGAINNCIRGKIKSAFGYQWEIVQHDIIEGEIWRDFYNCKISNYGRGITKHKKPIDMTINKKGYEHFEITIEGVRRHLHIARVVLELFLCPPPFEGAQADHIDGDKRNNHISNLRWLSLRDNVQEYWRNKRLTN
jgi:hypothetical protein